MTRTKCFRFLLRRVRLGSNAFFIPLLILLLPGGCREPENLGFPFFSPSREPNRSWISYRFTSLYGERPAFFGQDSGERAAPLTRTILPEFFRTEGRVCLSSLASFFAASESGFQLVYCSPEPEPLEDLLEALSFFSPDVSAYRRVSGNRFSLETLSWAKLRDSLSEEVVCSIDGGISPDQPTLEEKGLSGWLVFRSALRGAGGGLLLPLRFSLNRAHILVLPSETLLALPFPDDPKRLRVIHIHDPLFSRQLQEALFQLKEVLPREATNSTEAKGAFLSEYRLHSADPETGDFLEITAGNPGLLHVALEDVIGVSCEISRPVHGHSTILIHRENCEGLDFSGISQVEINGQVRRIRDTDSMYAGRSRSLRITDENGAALVSPCLGAYCDRRGVGPDFEGDPSQDFCQPEDFALSEWNPWGMYLDDSDSRNPGGKFLEWVVLRHCRGGRTVFLVDDLVLEPGTDRFAEGEVLLFAPSQSPFLSPVIVHSAVRRLSETSTLRGLDYETGKFHSYFAPRKEASFVFKGKILRSLVVTAKGSSGFFKGETGGVRPDLTEGFRGNPGTISSDTSESECPLTISEIAPVGSKSSGEGTIASDEFIEFRSGDSQTGAASLCELTVTTLDEITKTYLFSPEESGGFLVLYREMPICFPHTEKADRFVGSPFLPNAPAHYLLRDGLSGRILDRVSISQESLGVLNGDTRRSLERVRDDLWAPSTSIPENPDCETLSYAGPHREPAYSPFVRLTPCEPSLCAILESQDTSPEKVQFTIRTSPDETPLESTPLLEPGEPFPFPPLESNRAVVEWRLDDMASSASIEWFASLPALVVDEVIALPPEGEEDSVRLCSPGGFRFALGRLYLDDGENRISVEPAPGESDSLLPGECARIHSEKSPILQDGDTGWIAHGTGPDLSSKEGFLILFAPSGRSLRTIASSGLPDSSASFSFSVSTGQRVKRVRGTLTDKKENYRVLP